MHLARKNFSLLVFSLLLPQVVGAVGALFTFPSIANWYIFLEKPQLTPPNWIFGPVWTLLYILMGISLFLIIVKKPTKKEVRALQLFFLQLALNLLWSIVFFGFRSIEGGVIVIILLWCSILGTILLFSKISQLSSVLLLPYLAWVTFATYLNIALFWLNL